MNFIRIYIVLCWFFVLSSNAIKAQYTVELIDRNTGLQGYNRFAIFQDTTGLMWALTERGLHLFDGKKFLRCIPAMQMPNCYRFNNFDWATPMQDGNFLIATKLNLSIFNPYERSIEKVFEGRTLSGGVLMDTLWWITEDSLYVKRKRRVNSFNLKNTAYFAIADNSIGRIYIMGNNPKGRSIEYWQSETLSAISIEDTLKYFSYINDTMWVTTKDKKGYNLTQLIDQNVLKKRNLILLKQSTNSDKSIFFEQLDDDTLRYRDTKKNIEHIFTLSSIGIESNYRAFIDADGSVWLSGYNYIKKITWTDQNFKSIHALNGESVRKIMTSRDGKMILSAISGTYILDYSDRTPGPVLAHFKRKTYRDIIELNDSIYLGASSNNWIELLDKNFKTKYTFGGLPKIFNSNITTEITKWNDRIFIGTETGLFVAQLKEDSLGKLNLEVQQNLLLGIPVNSLIPYDAYTLLVGSEQGLYVYHTKSNDLHMFESTKGLQIKQISRNQSGKFFLATANYGIFILDKKFKIKKHYNRNNGLANDECYAIRNIDSNPYWVSSFSGLSIIDTTSDEVVNFDRHSGLPFEEFNRWSFFQDTVRGTIYFGGVGGVVYFDPLKIKPEPSKRRIIFTNIEVQTKNKKKNFIAAYHQNPKTKIPLNYDDKYIELSFAFTNYKHSQSNEYAYQIDNGEKIQLKHRQKLILNSLPAGNRQIRIYGRSVGKKWTSNPALLHIKSTPILYQRTWFLFCISGLTLLAFYMIYKKRINSEKQEKEKILKQKQLIWKEIEREKQDIASRLHDELGQELTLIANNKKIANDQKLYRELLNCLELIRHVSSDIYPYQIKTLGLNVAINSMVSKLNDKHRQTFFSADIECLNENLSIDKQLILFRIIQEAFTNIIKHAQAESAAVYCNPKLNQIIIRDDGVGLPQDLQYGQGLSGLEDKVNLLGAQFSLVSKPGEGTKIIIQL